jgi:hypothetical protein
VKCLRRARIFLVGNLTLSLGARALSTSAPDSGGFLRYRGATLLPVDIQIQMAGEVL